MIIIRLDVKRKGSRDGTAGGNGPDRPTFKQIPSARGEENTGVPASSGERERNIHFALCPIRPSMNECPDCVHVQPSSSSPLQVLFSFLCHLLFSSLPISSSSSLPLMSAVRALSSSSLRGERGVFFPPLDQTTQPNRPFFHPPPPKLCYLR